MSSPDDDLSEPKGLTGKTVTVNTQNPPGAESQFAELQISDKDPGQADMGKPVGTKKKKKRNKKSATKTKGSGFEGESLRQNFADAPITPVEYEEETNDIYHPRIELCIQRYRAKRRFDNEQRNIFDKYLSLGGIDVGPKMFNGGLDPKELDEADVEQIRAITATDSVGGNKARAGSDGSDWIVDFEGIAKCFFSSARISGIFDFGAPGSIERATGVVRNFLNYILYHNVCPEYNDQVNAARSICDLAQKEHRHIIQASLLFPGKFNVACSTLYGGCYQGLWAGDKEWAKGLHLTLGMSDRDAKAIVMMALSAYGTHEQVEQASKEMKVVKTEYISFEIIEILPPPQLVRTWYEETVPDLKPFGKVKVKQWIPPYPSHEDIGEDVDDSLVTEDFELLLEESILSHCFKGMKIRAEVSHLNCGFSFFDTVTAVDCSFFLWLPCEALVGWKEPVDVSLSPRPLDIVGTETVDGI
ncbi:MAG: hypothetical protein M1838_003247, partial [Thelocarpon superellum]